MARLPEALPDPIGGTRGPIIGVEPTDFGLSQLAGNVAGFAENREKTDKLVVQPRLLDLRKQNETAFATDAAGYTSDQPPGFAGAQIAKARDRAAAAAADPSLSRGERQALMEAANNETARVGEQAIAREADVQSKPIAELAAAKEATEVSGYKTAWLNQWAAPVQALHDGYNGEQDGYHEAVGAELDKATAAVLATVPDRLKGRVQADLLNTTQEEKYKAAVTEQLGKDAFVLQGVRNNASTQINGISSNPNTYDAVKAGLPDLVAGAPLGMRKGLMHELEGQAAEARIDGLVAHGQADQAHQELNVEGRYDTALDPKVKERLDAKIEHAQMFRAPRTMDEATAAQQLKDHVNARISAIATTGEDPYPDDWAAMAARLSVTDRAEVDSKLTAAHQMFAAAGPVHDMPNAELSVVMAKPPPDPSEPDYAGKLFAWQAQQQAAQLEQKARLDGPGRAFTVTPHPKGAAAGGAGQAQDQAAVLQGAQHDFFNTAPGTPQRKQAGANLARLSLGAQYRLGIDPSARGVVPQQTMDALAASVSNAPPEGRGAAMLNVAQTIADLPATVLMPDGTTAAPQAMMLQGLAKAHLTPMEISAITDFGSNPTLMGRFATVSDAGKGAEDLQEAVKKGLRQQVVTALQPWLATLAPMPGGEDMTRARIDRTVLMAKWHIDHEKLSPAAAAQAAAKDLTSGYRMADGWRMPIAAAGAQVNVTSASPYSHGAPIATTSTRDGLSAAKMGAARMLSDLTSRGSQLLYSARGTTPDQQAVYAAQVQHSAHWVTTADDSGLQLMTPNPDYTWSVVHDKWGQPVRATWQQLNRQASSGTPSPFLTPPPNVLRDPDGRPVRAMSKVTGFNAVASAVEWQEHGGGGAISPKGAIGKMQLMPATIDTYAPRVGETADYQRARVDDAYNRKIGQAALLDNVNHYGSGAGLVLAIAAYNAGRGRIEGYTDKGVYHEGWLKTLGDPRTGQITTNQWVERIPYPETRDYVKAVLRRAIATTQQAH